MCNFSSFFLMVFGAGTVSFQIFEYSYISGRKANSPKQPESYTRTIHVVAGQVY